MRSLSLGLLLLGSAACSDKSSPPLDDSGPHGEDSLPVDDTAPDTVEPRTGEISGALSVPSGVVEDAAVTVALVRIDYGSGPDLRGTVVASAALDAASTTTYTLSLDARPPEEDLSELEPTQAPGLVGALYVPLAFVDQDNNGSFVSGERIVGGSLSRLVVWLEGTLPEGVTAGWSVVDTGLSGTYETGNCLLDTTNPLFWREAFNRDYPAFYDLEEPVDVSLQGLLAAVQLGGVAVGLDTDLRVALLPYQVVYQGEPLAKFPTLSELALGKGGAFALSLDTAPSSALDISPDTAWDYALAFAVPYRDEDGDGQYSTGEVSGDESLCSGNSLAAVRYTWPVETYRGWRLMECYDVTAGWRVVTRDSTGAWVKRRSDAEAADLRIDAETCSR